MELLSFNLQQVALPALLFIICLCSLLWRSKRVENKKGRTLPEVAGAWPLFGHLHLLASDLPHRVLAAMADRYGPAFSIRLGIHRALVISGWEVAKECFTVNDRVFPTRPRLLSLKIMGYDHTMFAFAPYGPYWRDMRKLAMTEVLSNHRVEFLKHVRDAETRVFVKELHQKWLSNSRNSVMVDMNEEVGNLVMNIVVRTIAGKRYPGGNEENDEESRRCQKAMGDFLIRVGQFMVSDAVPFLGWLDILKGHVAEMKRIARELDWVLGSWVEDHRQRRAAGKIQSDEQDFIHFMLSAIDADGKHSAQEVDTIIKANCLSLVLGGNETTVATLTWALSLLLNKPLALRKAQHELDEQVGKHRWVEESDIKNLSYLQAVIKETMRLYPALPLSGPREAMDDCTVAGFHVPAGTRLMVNLWKLHRDPRVWSDPLEFRPERFLTSHADVDIRGHSFECIPFGTGRRMCPGVSFGLVMVHLILARVLHRFELEPASGFGVDMSEGPGLTMPRATPLRVFLTPKLPDGHCH